MVIKGMPILEPIFVTSEDQEDQYIDKKGGRKGKIPPPIKGGNEPPHNDRERRAGSGNDFVVALKYLFDNDEAVLSMMERDVSNPESSIPALTKLREPQAIVARIRSPMIEEEASELIELLLSNKISDMDLIRGDEYEVIDMVKKTEEDVIDILLTLNK